MARVPFRAPVKVSGNRDDVDFSTISEPRRRLPDVAAPMTEPYAQDRREKDASSPQTSTCPQMTPKTATKADPRVSSPHSSNLPSPLRPTGLQPSSLSFASNSDPQALVGNPNPNPLSSSMSSTMGAPIIDAHAPALQSHYSYHSVDPSMNNNVACAPPLPMNDNFPGIEFVRREYPASPGIPSFPAPQRLAAATTSYNYVNKPGAFASSTQVGYNVHPYGINNGLRLGIAPTARHINDYGGVTPSSTLYHHDPHAMTTSQPRTPQYSTARDHHSTQPPATTTALPPSSLPERAHVLEVECGTLEMAEDGPDMLPTGWLERGHFFIAVHCVSPFVPLHSVPIPHHPPGKKVVRTKLAERKKLSCDFDSEPVTKNLTRHEQMALLDVWSQKSHILTGAEEAMLLGRVQIDLRGYPRMEMSAFKVYDGNAMEVGTLWFKLHLVTTPERVQSLHFEDVTSSSVRLVWEPPTSDGGRKIEGYKIQLQEVDIDPTWKTICDHSESPISMYPVSNLRGHTRCRFEVSAINSCGAGDCLTIEGMTGPIPPSVTSAPQIVEERDNSVRLCWEASEDNGGSELLSFKVMMRKLTGASKWNPFGPSEKNAVWVDMGTVEASSSDSESHVERYFSAWVGPLEPRCEYRFKTYAINKLGLSDGSELSESHWT